MDYGDATNVTIVKIDQRKIEKVLQMQLIHEDFVQINSQTNSKSHRSLQDKCSITKLHRIDSKSFPNKKFRGKTNRD